MELGRRLAEERDLERSSVTLRQECPVFNETSDFLMYPTLIGVKCVNLTTNKCSRLIGKVRMFQNFAGPACHSTNVAVSVQ